MAESRIIIDTVNFSDTTKIQFDSQIYEEKDGMKIYPLLEETGFIFQDFSGFAPKKFIKEEEKRNYVRVQLMPDQEACNELKSQLKKYDDVFETTKDTILGKWANYYKFSKSVKLPKKGNIFDEPKPDEQASKPKYESCRLGLNKAWHYYYEGERLDRANEFTIQKAIRELNVQLKQNKTVEPEKRALAINALPITLTFKENDKRITKNVRMQDIKQVNEFDINVFYRKPTRTVPNAKKPNECTEEELIQYYGEPGEPKAVRSPDDLDQYYGHRCYVRFLYSPQKFWAAKNSISDDDIRQCGIKYVVKSIDIIQIPYESNSNSQQKNAYRTGYGFGKIHNNFEHNDLLINQSVEATFSPDELIEPETHEALEQSADAEGEESGEEESEDEDEDDEDEDEDDEDEEEVKAPEPVKPAPKTSKAPAKPAPKTTRTK